MRLTTIPFERTVTVWYALWGLVPFDQPDIKAILDEEVARVRGRGVARLEIETGMKVPMIFANCVTSYVTIYNQQVIIRGEIYR